MRKDGTERFIGVNARNLRIYMQPVRDLVGKICGFFARFELNLQKSIFAKSQLTSAADF